MLRKLFFLVVAIASLTCSAASLPFDVETPNIKFVTANGVNIRKSPSTSAQRLMYNVEDAEMAEEFGGEIIDVTYWSSAAPTAKRKAFPFRGPAKVVSESNGWYEINGYGAEGRGTGWVSASVTKPYTPASIVYPKAPVEYESWKWITGMPGVKDGEYALAFEWVGDACPAIIYVGKIVNGMLVCPYSFGTANEPVNIIKDEDYPEAKLLPPGASFFETGWTLVLGKAENQKDNLGYEFPVFNKINNNMVAEIISKATPLPSPVVICPFNEYSLGVY